MRIKFIIALLLSQSTVMAAENYHLFNPVPASQMRDLSADRPDATESPITVDAGHYQVELSFMDFGRDTGGGETTETWGFMETNVKAGLTENIDLQFVFSAYTSEEVRGNGSEDTTEGFDDVQVRMKINFWGNDGGDTALGIMPFIKIPAGDDLSNDHVEGGVILPFSWDVHNELGLGAQLEADFVYNQEKDRYDVEFLHSIVAGHDLTDSVGLFIEYVGVLGDATNYRASTNGGLTYTINRDLMFDAGYRVGLNSAAEDVGAFFGLTYRY